MELQINTKLQFKQIPGIAEVCGIYPGGQASQKDTEYELLIDGVGARMKESLVETLFEQFKPDQPSNEVVEDVKPKSKKSKLAEGAQEA